MKKIIVFIMLLIVAATSFSQQTKPSPSLSKQDYLKKSKSQKTAALILLGGGVICTATGMMLINTGKEIQEPTGSFWGIQTYSTYHKNDGISGAFGLTGILSMLTSIPVFLAAHRNKMKGMRLSFKNEIVPSLQNGSFVNQSIPSLTLKIGL